MTETIHRYNIKLEAQAFDDVACLRKRFLFAKKATAMWELGDLILVSGPTKSITMRVCHVQDMAPKLPDYAALSLMTLKEWSEWPDSEKEAARVAMGKAMELQT